MKITAKQYAQFFLETVSGKTEEKTKRAIENFAKILIAGGDESKLEKVIAHFIALWNKEKGIVEAEITSARELEKEIVKFLRGYIIRLSGAREVELKQKVDKGILGGVIIKYGDMVADRSLKTRLEELKVKMVK